MDIQLFLSHWWPTYQYRERMAWNAPPSAPETTTMTKRRTSSVTDNVHITNRTKEGFPAGAGQKTNKEYTISDMRKTRYNKSPTAMLDPAPPLFPSARPGAGTISFPMDSFGFVGVGDISPPTNA